MQIAVVGTLEAEFRELYIYKKKNSRNAGERLKTLMVEKQLKDVMLAQ